MKTNKFNIHWQITRTRARQIKDVPEKIAFVLKFLKNNKNTFNVVRVLNWLEMTKLGYSKTPQVNSQFEDAIKQIKQNPQAYANVDNDNDLKNIATADLVLVYNDLAKRKYGFQFKSIPVAHTQFLKDLKQEINTR